LDHIATAFWLAYQLAEIVKLLHMQKEALTELMVELVTPSAMRRGNAGLSAQKTIIFRAKIEQEIHRLADHQDT
jgi:hypothetical protein